MIERGKITSLLDFKINKQLKEATNFWESPYGKGLMYQLELRVDRESDPDVPSIFEIQRQEKIVEFPTKK